MTLASDVPEGRRRGNRYLPPEEVVRLRLSDAIVQSGRTAPDDRRLDLFRRGRTEDVFIYCAGDGSLLRRPAVAIVGADALMKTINVGARKA